MKKLAFTPLSLCKHWLLVFMLLFATNLIFAQGEWFVEGNNLNYPAKDHFIGSLNDMPVRFKTNDIERMRLTETGFLGIGTETPTQLLDVNGQIRLRFGAASYKVLSSDASGNATWEFLQLDLSGNSLSVLNHGNPIDLSTYLDNTDAQTLSLAGTTLSISNANNVLFTAWDTDASDDFSGNYNDLSNLPTLFDGDYNSLSNLPILFDGNWSSLIGTPTVDELNYWSKLDDNLFYNTANVGIGIDVPQKLLHIHSDDTFIPGGGLSTGHIQTRKSGSFNNTIEPSSASSILFTNLNSGSTASDGLIIKSYNNNAIINLQETGSLTLQTKNKLRLKMQENGNISIGDLNTNFFTVKENGRVGIGTDEPENTLDVIGSSSISDDLFVGGRIGVGTVINTQYSLDVLGNSRINGNLKVCNTVYADELVATNPTWCDYVFEPDYSLMSITELENFVIQNKHLPNIPSATDVEREGIKLKEMNQLMMEKIEELTLYIIELNKRIENLERQN